MSRIAFLAIVAIALTILAGLDLRLAFASRELSNETALLDQHERRANAIGAVTAATLDQHERASRGLAATAFADLDQHERRATRPSTRGIEQQCGAELTASTFAALDQHERRAARQPCAVSR